MAWIEVHQSLWGHGKTLDLASRLKIKPIYAAAHLCRLWCWGLDNTQDGVLPRANADVIANAADWKGKSGLFLDALIAAGWVDRDDNGLFMLHDWMDYAGKLMARRERNKEQMRNTRGQHVVNTKATRGNTCKATVPTVPTVPTSTTTPTPSENFAMVWENSVGRPITGTEGQELGLLVDEYSELWVIDSITEAAKQGREKVGLKYITRILERWQVEGRGNGHKQTETKIREFEIM
jgi:hypothetical protein